MVRVPRQVDLTQRYSKATALVFAKFSRLAYSDEQVIKSDLMNTGFELIKFIQISARNINWIGKRNIECFVAFNADENSMVVSFRGTENKKEATISNTDNTSTFHGITTHAGYVAGYNLVKKELLKVVSKKASEETKIFFTGHSLGGSLAIIAAFDLKKRGEYNLGGVYTYGQPKTFETDPDLYGYHRVVYQNDPVPEINPGFKHFGNYVQLGERNLKVPITFWGRIIRYAYEVFFKGDHSSLNYINYLKKH